MRSHLRVPELPAIGAAATVLVLGLAAPGDVRAFSFCSPGKDASYRLGAEETHTGDLYTGGQTVDIAGTLDGDLVAWAQSINVTGDVRSELMGAAQTITIQGHVGDTTRVACNSLLIQGTLDGDLLVFAQTVTLAPGSRIRGDLVGFAQILNLGGEVDGDARVSGQNVNVSGRIGGSLGGTVGEAGLTGSVQHDVRLTCDKMRIAPGAHVGGDLIYKAREPVEDLESMDVVAGKIDYQKSEKKKEESHFTRRWFLWRLFFFGSSLVLGAILIALFRQRMRAVEAALEGEILPSFGVGFVISIVTPVAALLVCLLVVTIPLALITLVLWAIVVLFVAKLPVALWAGRRILRLVGLADPSPYLGLAVGLVVLYALLQLPYVWLPTYLVVLFLGFGSLALGLRSSARGGRSPAPGSSPSAA